MSDSDNLKNYIHQDLNDTEEETPEASPEVVEVPEPKIFIPAKVFGTSKKLETEGKKIDLGDGASIRIRRTNYPKAAEYMRKAMKPHAQAVKLGTFSDEQAAIIITQCLSAYLVVSWKGIFEPVLDASKKPVKDANKKTVYKEIPFSLDAAKRLFTEQPNFRKQIWEWCDSAETFKQQEDEEDEKN